MIVKADVVRLFEGEIKNHPQLVRIDRPDHTVGEARTATFDVPDDIFGVNALLLQDLHLPSRLVW